MVWQAAGHQENSESPIQSKVMTLHFRGTTPYCSYLLLSLLLLLP